MPAEGLEIGAHGTQTRRRPTTAGPSISAGRQGSRRDRVAGSLRPGDGNGPPGTNPERRQSEELNQRKVPVEGVEPPVARPLCSADVLQQLEISGADLGAVETGEAVLGLLDGYAREPTGMGAPLGRATRERLIPALRDHPTARVLLAWCDQVPVGLAVSFVGFSTFEARPLLNLHDLFVRSDYRRMGIGKALLSEVEALARRLGCCRVTLEVREDNRRALDLYSSFGFSGSPTEEERPTLFLTKML